MQMRRVMSILAATFSNCIWAATIVDTLGTATPSTTIRIAKRFIPEP
jgi:hypothetical protein